MAIRKGCCRSEQRENGRETERDQVRAESAHLGVPFRSPPRPPEGRRWYCPVAIGINYYQLTVTTANVALPLEVPPYAVTCVSMQVLGEGHRHLSMVETADPDGGQTHWTAAEVIAAIAAGERFVVYDDGQGREVILEPAACETCSVTTVRTDRPGVDLVPC